MGMNTKTKIFFLNSGPVILILIIVKILFRFLQIIYCVYALLAFILLMMVVCLLVIFFMMFGKIKAGNLVYKVCRLWGLSWYFLTGIRHKEIYEVPHDRKKQYIFVANHSSYLDIPSIVMSIHQPVRVLGKYEMVHYPVFGFIYRAAVILVDRKDVAQRAKSVRALKAAIKRGISIFIFPEGTFNTTGKPLKDFYDGAFRTAIETKTSIKPILFIDNDGRLNQKSIFSLTPGICRCVYLDSINIDAYKTKDDVVLLKMKVYETMENGLRRYRKYEV